MQSTLADRLQAARRRAFVGRAAELGLFADLLRAAALPVAVLFVHGPSGVGKTTLLRRFAEMCQEAGVRCLPVDARDVPPVREALAARLEPALAAGDGHGGGDHTRTVLLLDTYELLAELDGWVRDELLPRLPADTLVVLAGQHPPAAAWRTDPGWAELVRAIRLENLSDEESGTYLSRRGIDEALHAKVVDFTHGHPLALALVGEVLRSHGVFVPQDSPDVIKVLLDRLLQVVPSPAHRHALEACAQIRVTTEPLLAAMLDVPDATELFGWLRSLPFVDAGRSGLHLHDLAREVLATDLRWRHPERYLLLHDRARRHYLEGLDVADPVAQSVRLLDLMYLHDDLRPLLAAPAAAGGARVEPPAAEDHPAVQAMVERHEGTESADLAAYWLDRQPRAWQVVRGPAGDVVGAQCLLAIQDATPADRQADPAVAAAWRQLAGHPPLRPGEQVTLVRFWLARDTYQDVSPVQNLLAAQIARHYLTTPALAVSLVAFADPQAWAPVCAYADQHRMPAADFTVGGHPYGVYGHDWRAVPPAAWVALLSRRETGSGAAPATGEPAAALLVLGREEFATAVRRALRDLTRPDRLRESPLLRCRAVTARAGADAAPGQRVAVLQGLLREAAATLQHSPADERLHRVLHRAYLSPAPTLEAAAEVLDLPSSTFRRHLGAAVDRVVTLLWHQELEA